MQTTLAERLKDAMKGPPKVTGRALAKACSVSAPSVSDWLSGATKSLDGVNLIAAAEFLRVNPKWLATGLGLKYLPPVNPSPMVTERIAGYIQPQDYDEWTLAAIGIMTSLKEGQREGALAALRTHVGNLGPPHVGQDIPVAKKIGKS